MFYLPTRIIFGENALKDAAAHLALGKRALIVSGRSSAVKSGVMSELIPLLNELNIEHKIFAQIVENPLTSQVIIGKEVFLEAGCDFIIAIGGGSPLDAAKAIAIAAANDLSEDELYQLDLHEKSFPIVAIPTTHGTGSEVTQYSVLTHSKTKKKAGFGSDLNFPQLAIIDPRYMTSLSPKVSLHTALDALSHLLEGLYSLSRNEHLYPMIYRGIRLIVDNLSLCLREPKHLPARQALALASLYGGITIAHTGTTLQHAIGYPFTSAFDIPHGLANAMFMNVMMEFNQPNIEGIINQLFEAIKMSKEEFYHWLESFPIQIKVEISDDEEERWIDEILGARNIAASPRVPTYEELRTLIHSVKKGV